MFDNLIERFANSFKVLQGKHKLSATNIETAISDVRRALLEADVALEVIKAFLDKLSLKVIDMQVPERLSPYQAFIKIVEAELVKIIGAENQELNLKTQAPAVIMLVGLQGTGKTTTAAKLAYYLKKRKNKKVLLVSLDVYRPAAIEQLAILAEQAEVDCFSFASDLKPEQIVTLAKQRAEQQFYDVLLIDTAGRLHVDEQMMNEVKILQNRANPIETLFVVDAMSGQDSVNTAKVFAATLPLNGIILTKTDGDARGGAALSVKYVTGKPIKFLGVGEKKEALEVFYPQRIASRLLGMGDVLSLVEEIERKVDHKKMAKSASKMIKGRFDLTDMRSQFEQMQQMGGMQAILDKLPNMGKLSEQAKNKMMDDSQIVKMIAIIDSMTPKERIYIKLIKNSHKRRIAKGSGTNVQMVNRLIKQFEKMQKQMRKMGGGKMRKMMAKMQQMQNSAPTADKFNLANLSKARFGNKL